MRRLFFLALIGVFSFRSDAYSVSFSDSFDHVDGIPAGWQLTGNGTVTLMTRQPWSVGGESGLAFSFESAQRTNILCTTDAVIPNAEIACDNISARFRVYLQKAFLRSDLFQIVISTNNWASYETIGEPILLEEKGRTLAEWTTVERSRKIEGLKESGNDISVGILAGSGYRTGKIGYFQSLELSFSAVATPRDVHFDVGGERVSSLEPGESRAAVVASVDAYPTNGAGAVEVSRVLCTLVRNGVTNTLDMVEDKETSSWRCDVPAPTIEAGESLKAAVCTEYTSALDTLGKKTEDGIAREMSAEVEVLGTKLGSVWINEFTLERVELCGTPHRAASSGWAKPWTLELVDEGGNAWRADLTGAPDFTTNMVNGVVGLETHALAWRDAEGEEVDAFAPTNYVVRLRNPAGIVEHQETVTLPLAGSVGMTGCAAWRGDGYDWTGTATGDVFAWGGLTDGPSFGTVNDGQGFKVPIWARLVVKTDMQSGETTAPLSYATVLATGHGLGNDQDMSAASVFSDQSRDGVAEIVITNCYSATPGKMAVDLSVSAFGWHGVPQTLVVQSGDVSTNVFLLTPTVAVDDFEGGGLKGFWRNQDGRLRWQSAQQGGKGVLRLDTYATSRGTAALACANFLSPRGRTYASVSFDFMNYRSSSLNHDYFRVELSTNLTAGSVIATLPLVNNRYPLYGNGEWYNYQTLLELPVAFLDADQIWVRLVCDSDGRTSSYTTLDNLRIAFQDVALPTNLVRTVAAPASGESAGFALDVVPQTTGTVADVSADLHLVLNGVTNVVPFAFADGTRTNALAAGATLTLSAEALQAALGRPFLTGDEVTAFAAVHYDSANGEADAAKRRETRYFPDNAVTTNVDGTAYWIVEGGYAVNADLAAQSFTVAGAPLGCVGAPVATADGVRFTLHGYAASGLTNLTVRVGGVDYHPFEGLETNAQVRVTGDFELPTGLAPNTDYAVTVSAVDANGAPLPPATFSFTTLPTATAAAIAGVSPDEVRLTARGAAAGFVVPPGWTPCGAAAWTRRGAPNTRFTATVYATNRLGQASAAVEATPGFTHAAAATRAPLVEKGVTTVSVRAAADYAASDDGNPEGTEYAVCVATSAGATNVVDVWKTLAAWRDEPETLAAPVLDLLATNVFSFVTRSGDGVVTTSAAPATAACRFPPTAGFVDGAAVQRPAPERTVAFGLAFFDPAGVAAAEADVEWRVGDGAWTPVYESPLAVVFEGLAATNAACAWDAWAAVGEEPGEHPYALRVRMVSGGRASDWSEVSGVLDFAPPEALALDGAPADGAVTKEPAVRLAACAADRSPVTYRWTFNGAASTGDALTGTAREGANTVSVWAEDALGNASAPVTRTWTLDTQAPEALALDGTPADGAVTREPAVRLTAQATDATALTYHWTLNGAESTGDALEGTAREGANTAVVVAEDAAGNRSAPVVRTWTLDTTPPTAPVLSGAPARLTNATAVRMAARAEDRTALTYRWTLNGADSTGDALEGTAREGENAVSVVAVDAAGNVSPATAWTWTVDTTPPEGLAIAGAPEEGAVTQEPAVRLTAQASDASAVTYHWTLNGAASTGAALTGTAQEGKNTAIVVAEDAAGNRSAPVARTWTLDTAAPTKPEISGTPLNGAVTNETAFSLAAQATDATALTYRWTLTTPAGEWTATGATLAGAASADGAYWATVVAEDAAGNASAAAAWAWTVDTARPTVVLSSDAPAVFNAEKAPFAVTVAFSEPVDGFTAAAVAVENGAATAAEAVEGEANVYRVTIAPEKDGEVVVQVAADAVRDAAGNGNDASAALAFTYDTTPPTAALSSDAPAVFNAEKTPFAVTVAFDEPVTNFTAAAVAVENGAVETAEAVEGAANAYRVTIRPAADGKVSVRVAAGAVADAAGNANAASAALVRTNDTEPPTQPEISGTPARGAVTNETAFSLSAQATDATSLTYRWTLTTPAGERTATGATLAGAASADGAYRATVVAVDAAGNASAAAAWAWTVDTARPTAVLSSDAPDAFNAEKAPFAVTVAFSEPVDGFTAAAVAVENGAATAAEAVEGEANAYRVTIAPTADGEVVVQVAADAVRDAAGNGNDASAALAFTYDTTPPTAPVLVGAPARRTNATAVQMTARAEDATTLTYHWTLNGVASTGDALAGTAQEGENTVCVYAVDAAGNVGAATTHAWTVDTAPLTVTLADEGPAKDLYNAADAFTVTATFNKDVADVPAAAVAVVNGAAGAVEKIDGRVWRVTVVPAADGAVSVSLPAGAVADAAGNGNEASQPVTRRYDVTPPQVVLSAPTEVRDEKNSVLEVTAAFSEPVTNFTAASVEVVNGTVTAVAAADGEAATYRVTVVPERDGVYVVRIPAGAAADAAGNGNAASEALTRVYDTEPPTKPVISGTPAHGASVRTKAFRLVADATDTSGVTVYRWYVNGTRVQMTGAGKNELTSAGRANLIRKGLNTVTVEVRDAASHWSERSETYVWTYDPDTAAGGVAFGGGVRLGIDDATGETNRVAFTAAAFRPGAASALTLTGFTAEAEDVAGLEMWLVVCDTLGGAPWRVKVDAAARFDAATGALTVTVPEAATRRADGEPYGTLFVFGVANGEEAAE